MKRLSTSITWVVFVAYFSLLAGGAHGAVLCLGENGHIAIEAAQNGSCSWILPGFSLTDPPSHKPVISGPAKQHCGPCVDVDISTMHSYRMTPPVQKKFSPLQQKNSFSATTYVLFSKTPQGIVLSAAQFSKDRSATLLQTTILLI